jgi:hypothetical protein
MRNDSVKPGDGRAVSDRGIGPYTVGHPHVLGGNWSRHLDVLHGGQPQHHAQHHQSVDSLHSCHPYHRDNIATTIQHRPPTGGTNQPGLERLDWSPKIGWTTQAREARLEP